VAAGLLRGKTVAVDATMLEAIGGGSVEHAAGT